DAHAVRRVRPGARGRAEPDPLARGPWAGRSLSHADPPRALYVPALARPDWRQIAGERPPSVRNDGIRSRAMLKLITSSIALIVVCLGCGGGGAGGGLSPDPQRGGGGNTPPPSGGGTTQSGLGPGASLAGRRPFPADNPWNQDISTAPVDPNS